MYIARRKKSIHGYDWFIFKNNLEYMESQDCSCCPECTNKLHYFNSNGKRLKISQVDSLPFVVLDFNLKNLRLVENCLGFYVYHKQEELGKKPCEISLDYYISEPQSIEFNKNEFSITHKSSFDLLCSCESVCFLRISEEEASKLCILVDFEDYLREAIN